MIKKNFSRFNTGIFVLILLVAFLSACKQNSTLDEGSLTTGINAIKGSEQNESVGALAVYVPMPEIEYPDDANGPSGNVHGTLTPYFEWWSVSGATMYTIKLYKLHNNLRTKVDEYNLDATSDDLQSYHIPPGTLSYGNIYEWCVRARIGTSSSEYRWAAFSVTTY